MRRIFFICFVSIFSFSTLVNSQTIHWITFIDTTDPSVGELDQYSRAILQSHFINTINASIAENGYYSDIQDFYGVRDTPENCKKAIDGLKVEPNDIIVFYYIGHGGRSPQNKADKYPHLWFAQDEAKKMISLSWIHEQLTKKQARFTLTIGMCCNTEQSIIPSQKKPTFSLCYGNASIDEKSKNNIQRLFLESTGDIIVSSSKPSESSYGQCCDVKADCFTGSLIYEFEETVKSDNCSWDVLWNRVKNSVYNSIAPAKEMEYIDTYQTPQFDINIKTKDKPVKSNTVEINEDKISNWQEDLINSLNYLFDVMVSGEVVLSDKISLKNELIDGLYTSNAIVKIVGQDSETVIDKTDIDTYLSRIITTKKLLKVVCVGGQLENNNSQISELYVREYYVK